LDTTTRKLTLGDSQQALISDTVGFIRKLPHHLVEAFKATLEELKYADLLIHVIDASSPEWQEQVRIVDNLIVELGAGDTPRLEAFNKCDIYTSEIRPRGENIVEISAKTKQGIDTLLEKIEKTISAARKQVCIRLPYDKAGLVELLHRETIVKETRYLDDKIEVEAIIDSGMYERMRAYIM
jgi:GTP-binding protein HflX